MEVRHDAGGIAGGVEFAILVLAKPGEVVRSAIQEKRAHPFALRVLGKRPDAAADEVAEDVVTCQARDSRSMIDVAPDNRVVPLRMVVIKDGIHQSRSLAVGREIEEVRSLLASPAKVGAALCARQAVHLLKAVLADVANPDVSRGPIERETERIAQAVEPDFAASGWLVKERIARGNVIGKPRVGRRVHINAQDLAEQRGGVLPIANSVLGSAKLRFPADVVNSAMTV